jgi:hypothetical protein
MSATARNALPVQANLGTSFPTLATKRRNLAPSNSRRPLMKALIATVAAMLVGPAALAAPPGGPPGPPIDRIATEMGLDATQTAAVKQIMADARARIDAAARQSMAQADTELATVLTVEQVTEFKKLMQASRPHGPPPGSPPPSTDQ